MGSRSHLNTVATVSVVASIIIGVSLLGISRHTFQERMRFVSESWPIRAHVIALQPDGDNPDHAAPIVRFTTYKGDEVRLLMPGVSLSPGTTVNVLYDEDDPENIRINTYWNLWFAPWAFGLAGGLLTLVPLATIAWYGRPKWL